MTRYRNAVRAPARDNFVIARALSAAFEVSAGSDNAAPIAAARSAAFTLLGQSEEVVNEAIEAITAECNRGRLCVEVSAIRPTLEEFNELRREPTHSARRRAPLVVRSLRHRLAGRS